MGSHKDSIRAICLPNGSSNYQPVILVMSSILYFYKNKTFIIHRFISFAIVFVGGIVFVFVLPSGSINYQPVIRGRSVHNFAEKDYTKKKKRKRVFRSFQTKATK